MQLNWIQCNGMKWYGWMPGTCSIYSRSHIREFTAYTFTFSFHFIIRFSSHYWRQTRTNNVSMQNIYANYYEIQFKKENKNNENMCIKTKFSGTAPHDVEENQKNKKINLKTNRKKYKNDRWELKSSASSSSHQLMQLDMATNAIEARWRMPSPHQDECWTIFHLQYPPILCTFSREGSPNSVVQ